MEKTTTKMVEYEEEYKNIVIDNFYSQHENQKKEVQSQQINWNTYENTYLNPQTLKLIKTYDQADQEMKLAQLNQAGSQYAEVFISLLHQVKDQSVIQYVLTLIDEMLFDPTQKNRAELFLNLTKVNESFPFKTLIRLLSQPDNYISYLSSKILSELMLRSYTLDENDIINAFGWVINQLKDQNSVRRKIVVLSLKRFLRKDHLRKHFVDKGGFQLIARLLHVQFEAVEAAKELNKNSERDLQFIYDLIFCFWVISFNKEIAEKNFTEQSHVIANIVGLIGNCEIEKIRRIGLSCLKNLCNHGSNNPQMIHAKLHHVLKILSNKIWGDEDISGDIDVLNGVVDKTLLEMTSWDKYKQEVLSEELDWTPCHKSEKFWRDNVHHFGQNNFELVGVLTELLQSQNPRVQAVACHDLGEFSRFHSRGKRFIQENGIHTKVMILLTKSNEEEVKRSALLCLQKIMIANWEYLTR